MAEGRGGGGSTVSAPEPLPSRAARRWALAILAAAFVLGLVARAGMLSIAPRWGFSGDHIDYVCWGRQTVRAGVLDVYRNGPGQCPADLYLDGARRRVATGTGERLNYPALAAYVFAFQGWLHRRLDPEAIANTLVARTVYATGTTAAELATALGVRALVASFAGPTAATAGFAATWLAPPLLLDGPFWGQTESWVLGPATWMVVAMTRSRWLTAGVWWGVTLALKPSGMLFGPLWLYAFLFRPARVRIVLAGLVAVVAVNVFALPFWLDSGDAWLRATFLENFVYKLQWTTAMAFNVWYADLLATGELDPRVPVFGLTRDTWGGIFLATGLAAAFGLARRFERRNPARAHLGMLPAATLLTLAAIMLPTRVHSTYGAFTTPFLVATAFLLPRTVLGAAACFVTISLQILSWQWGNLLAMHVQKDESVFPAEQRARRVAMRAVDRPREWALTIANLAAAGLVFVGVAASPPRRRDEDA